METPATEISTGVASPKAIASRERIAAQSRRCISLLLLLRVPAPAAVGVAARAQHRPRLADGDDRPGDEYAARADRLAEGAAGLGQGGGLVEGVGQRGCLADPVLAEDAQGDLGELGGGHRAAVEFCVQTTWASTGSNSESRPS